MHVPQVRVRTVLWALVIIAVMVGSAQAADRFVSTTGTDSSNDCLTSASPCLTIGYGLAQAASGDSVKVAGGTYLEHIVIGPPATTLTISGGWTADFGSRDPAANTTTLDGGRALYPVLLVQAPGISVDLAIDGVTIQRGNSYDLMGGAQDGGGIRALSAGSGELTLSLIDSILSKNVAAAGGAIFADSYDGSTLALSLTRVTLSKNIGRGVGGAIGAYAFDGSHLSLTLTACTLSKNKALADSVEGGGAIAASAVTGNLNLNLSLDRTVFVKNISSQGNGGALYAANFNLTAVNTTFVKNRARRFGGAVYGWVYGFGSSASMRLTNCTMTENASGLRGGGVAVYDTTLDLTNNIIWRNRAREDSPDLYASAVGGTSTHNDNPDLASGIPGITDGGGNIAADPAFGSPPHNLHLRAGSPCIDTGTCTGAPTTDIDGDPRPTGASCDMGADEFVP